MNGNQGRRIVVKTIAGDSVSINIIDSVRYDQILASVSVEIVEVIKNSAGERNVYRLSDDVYLIYYSKQFSLLIEGYDTYKRISRNEINDLITIIYDRNLDCYFCFFQINPRYTKLVLNNRHHIPLSDAVEEKSTINENIVQFDDDSVMVYIKRTEHVYQGIWCVDFNSFKYLRKRKLI